MIGILIALWHWVEVTFVLFAAAVWKLIRMRQDRLQRLPDTAARRAARQKAARDAAAALFKTTEPDFAYTMSNPLSTRDGLATYATVEQLMPKVRS